MEEADLNLFADMKYFLSAELRTPTTLHIQRVATHLIWKHCWMTIGNVTAALTHPSHRQNGHDQNKINRNYLPKLSLEA